MWYRLKLHPLTNPVRWIVSGHGGTKWWFYTEVRTWKSAKRAMGMRHWKQ